MKLDELQAMWEKDSDIDRTELGEESLRIPQLHSKYYKLFANERLLLRKMESDCKDLYRLKHEYYSGTISEDDLKNNGWDAFQLKILKTDMPLYLQGDIDIRNSELKIEMQQTKVDFLESIIRNLPARGYQINSAIAWEKFKAGS